MAKQVQVQNLFQYPVKSLAGVATQSLTVDGEGRALGDRGLAFRFNDSGPAMRQTSQGGWWYKDRLLSLMHIPAAAPVSCEFDSQSTVLSLRLGDRIIAEGEIGSAEGRTKIEQSFERFLKDLSGASAIDANRFPIHLEGDGVSGRFHDRPAGQISMHSVESGVALSDAIGESPLMAQRFRSNVVIRGLHPWQELELIGSAITIGASRYEVTGPIIRCRAVHANPSTGLVDQQILRVLTKEFGQEEPTFGVLLKPIGQEAVIHVGDVVEVGSSA